MRTFIFVFFAAALAAPAQRLSYGIKAGVPLTDPLPSFGTTGMVDTGRWTIGPTLELRLFRGLSVEVDALYRGYRAQQSMAFQSYILEGEATVPLYSAYQQKTKAWDFPFLVKYRFTESSWKPFIAGGATLTHESYDLSGTLSCLGTDDACGSSYLGPFFHEGTHISSSRNRTGATAALGVEHQLGRVRIAPEVRYTRYEYSNRNQMSLLVGFTF